MKCGDKWSQAHRCPKQVPLHILEEVLDAMNVEVEQVVEEDKDIDSSDE